MSTTHRTGPIVCVTTWETVMEAAGWQCQCAQGLCGSKHSRTGLRCDRNTNRVRLIAAPLDLTLSALAASRVPVTELRAWCPECHQKAGARQRASERELQRREPAPVDALFDL
jgi:hypothetical protein